MLDKEMLDMVRDAFTSEKGKDIALSDELLSMVIENNSEWDNLSDDAKVKFLEQAQEQAQKVMVSDPGISVLISKMDEEFHKAIAGDIEAVVKNKNNAIHTYASFRRVFTREELDSMPIPGTELEHVTGNQRPDKVKTKDHTGKPMTVTWSNDFVSAMPECKVFDGDLDDVAKETKAPGSVPRFKGKSKQQIAAIKSDATQRRNALRSMVKRAISLHHQWEAISSMEKVQVEWITGTKERFAAIIPEGFGEGDNGDNPTLVTVAPRSIWIYPKGQASQGRDFSVTQFLSFDPALALNGEGGGTMADLVATAGRGADEPEGDGTGDGADMPVDAAQAVASQFYNWLNKRENMATVLKKIANRKADPEGNDWLDLVGSIYLAVKPVYEKNKANYEELQNKNAA